jgi:hypothetical protein
LEFSFERIFILFICASRNARAVSFSLPICPYPVKRIDNAESASNPSNYIPRTQFHLNIAEFGGDKHRMPVPGSHSPDARRNLRDSEIVSPYHHFYRFDKRHRDLTTQGNENEMLLVLAGFAASLTLSVSITNL